MPQLRDKSVLIVDDDPDVVTSITMALTDQGAKVFQAVDGAQAVDINEKEKPDLVVLDMMLPKRLRVSGARKNQEGQAQRGQTPGHYDHRQPRHPA